MLNAHVPSYLEPPSQEERDRLALAQQTLQDRASQQIERRIAMAKLQGDTSQLQAAGLSQEDARQQALLNNAPKLFPDDPEQMARIQTTIQAAINRKQAIAKYQKRLGDLLQEDVPPSEAAAQAFSEFGPDITTAGFAPMISSMRRADVTQKGLIQKHEDFLEREKRIMLEKEADRTSKENMFSAGLISKREIADQSEAGRNARAAAADELKARGLDIQAKRAAQPSASTLKQIASLDEEIRSTKRTLAKHITSEPTVFGKAKWKQTKEALETELAELERERDSLKTAPEPDGGGAAAAPSDTPAVRKYDPRTGKLSP